MCGRDMSTPFLTMTWNPISTMTQKNQEDKHYCEDCVEQVCWVTAYVFHYLNKENLTESLEINNNNNIPNPYWKGCKGCNEKTKN